MMDKMFVCFAITVTLVTMASCEPVVTMANIGEKLHLLQPSFLLIEQLFQVDDTQFCMEKMLCLLEPEMPNGDHNPFKHFSRYLTNTHHDFDDLSFTHVQDLIAKFPKLTKIVDSIKFGQRTNSSLQCDARYASCGATKDELLAVVNAYSDENIAQNGFPHVGKRGAGCDWGVLGCTGLGAACAACIAVSAGTCTAACGTTVLSLCAGFNWGCVFQLG